MTRYARKARDVLRGANAAPYGGSGRRRPVHDVDWARLQPGGKPIHKDGSGPEIGNVRAISLTVEAAPEVED